MPSKPGDCPRDGLCDYRHRTTPAPPAERLPTPWLAGGFRVALGWLWGAYRLASNRLWGGFDGALMWLWMALMAACPAFRCWKLDVGCWMFGIQHKHPEYNSPSAPPSERSGGTLDKLWTCLGTIEPPQPPVFDQPGLSQSLPYGVATKSIRSLDSGPEQSEAMSKFSPQNPCSSAFICGSLLHIDTPQCPTPTR